jgi:hypothetical protein
MFEVTVGLRNDKAPYKGPKNFPRTYRLVISQKTPNVT